MRWDRDAPIADRTQRPLARHRAKRRARTHLSYFKAHESGVLCSVEKQLDV